MTIEQFCAAAQASGNVAATVTAATTLSAQDKMNMAVKLFSDCLKAAKQIADA